MNLDQLCTFVRALGRERVQYVVIGGAALNAHGIIRATEDIDIMVLPTPSNVASLRNALKSIWQDDSIDSITSEDLNGEYPVVRYGPPEGTVYIDIIARLGDAFAFDDIQSQTVSLKGVSMVVATPTSLYRMKKNTVRDIDRADAAALRARFVLDEE